MLLDDIVFDPEKEYSAEEARDLFAKLLRKKVHYFLSLLV